MEKKKVKISIGDWSQDGHNQCEQFVFETNKPVKKIQDAYKESCKKTGLQFNYNQNYSGLPEHNSYGTDIFAPNMKKTQFQNWLKIFCKKTV